MDKSVGTLQSSPALPLSLSLNGSFGGVEESPSGSLQKQRAVGRRLQPVKVVKVLVTMLG